MQNIRYTLLFFLLLTISSAARAQSWKSSTRLPAGTDGAFGFAIGDRIFFGGGSGSKAFFEFDPSTAQWTKRADVPAVMSARSFAVAFGLGGYGYVTTGQDNNAQSQAKNDLWQYDPTHDKWTKRADVPGTPRDGAIGFVIGGKAYVGGGASAAGDFLGDFYSYDPALDHWKKLGDMPFGPPKYLPDLFFGASFTIGNFGYVTSGSTGGGETNDLYRYDPSSDTWLKKAALPGAARQAATSFALYGKGFVGLGMAGYDSDKVFNDFYSYDPTADKWSNAGLFLGTNRAWAKAVQTNTSVYVGGGWNLKVSPFFVGWWRFDTLSKAPTKPGYIITDRAVLDFGSHKFGTDSILTVNAINSSWTFLTIDSLKITGPNAADFSMAPATYSLPYAIGNGPDTLGLPVDFHASSPAKTEGAMLSIYFDGVSDSIRQVVLRGSSTGSESVESGTLSSQIEINPNPVRDRAIVSFTVSVDGVARLVIRDLLGRQVYEAAPKRVLSSSRSFMEIDTRSANLAAGVYSLELGVGSQRFGQKLVVVR